MTTPDPTPPPEARVPAALVGFDRLMNDRLQRIAAQASEIMVASQVAAEMLAAASRHAVPPDRTGGLIEWAPTPTDRLQSLRAAEKALAETNGDLRSLREGCADSAALIRAIRLVVEEQRRLMFEIGSRRL